MLQQTIPDKLIGLSNKKKLRSMMGQFVRMKRFEKFKMDDFLKAMDVFEVEWIGVDRNKRHHRQ